MTNDSTDTDTDRPDVGGFVAAVRERRDDARLTEETHDTGFVGAKAHGKATAYNNVLELVEEHLISSDRLLSCRACDWYGEGEPFCPECADDVELLLGQEEAA